MAGPRPDDSYNPVPEVAPQTGMPNDTLSVRASGANFGAQVGDALDAGGQKLKEGQDKLLDVKIQQLGLANEHAAQAGDLQLGIQGGERFEKFRSMEGLDAANSKDAFIKDYTDLNNKIRASLGNPAAQRAYDAVATRRMLFTIQEANDYAADQTKKAYRQGNKASNDLAAQEAARYEVASNPGALGDKVGTVIFNTNTDFTAPDYGSHRTIPSTTDPKTGKLQFDTSTPQGKNAQAEYDNTLAQETDKIYTRASETLLFGDKDHPGNVSKAVDFLKSNQEKMSPGTYGTQMAKFSGRYENELAHQDVSQTIGEFTHNYQYQPGVAAVYSTNLGNVKTANGSFANPATPIDGAMLAASNLRSANYKGKTIAQIGATWTGESPEKTADWVKNVTTASGLNPDVVPDLNNPQVLKALVKGISVAEKNTNDRKAFTDDVISQGVDGVLSGKQAVLSQGNTPTLAGGIHQSLPDFLGGELPRIMQAARDKAAARGGDTVAQDKAAQLAEAQVNQLRSGQAGEIRNLRNGLLQKIMDEKNPITSVVALDHGDPETQKMWIQYQTLDTYGAQAMQRIVNANAQGRSKTFGTDFYSHLTDVLSGKVKDVSQLQDYIGGDNTPISVSGVRMITKTMEGLETPEGQAFAHAESQFLETMRGQVTGTAIYPTANAAILKEDFNKQLMAKVPQIEALKADLTRQGKNPMEMFDVNSKDYIGKDIVPISQDKLNKIIGTSSLAAMAGGNKPTPAAPVTTASNIPKGNTFDTSKFNNVDDVGLAMQRGDITPDQAHKIVHDRFGGFAPLVPAPQ